MTDLALLRCIKAPVNEETLEVNVLRLRPQEKIVAEAKFASREVKRFLHLFGNILLPQRMFPSLRAEETLRETKFPQQCFFVCGRDSESKNKQ